MGATRNDRKSRIEATYKAMDVEEIIDIHFYRPIGYAIALASRKTGISPNALSVVGMLIGMFGGHLFFYNDLLINCFGIVCWMLGQAFDGADGQLARMTDSRSKMGRVLDGLSDSFKFLSVYVHITLRIALETGYEWVYLVGLAAAMSHSAQSAFADYYRNLYLYFVYDPNKGELDKSSEVEFEFSEMRWSVNPVRKLLWWLYIPYTSMQERMSKGLERLRALTDERLGNVIPQNIQDEYRRINKPYIRYYNALTTNTRMLVLYAGIFFDGLWWYLAFDLIVLNGLLVVMRKRQDANDERIMTLIEEIAPKHAV